MFEEFHSEPQKFCVTAMTPRDRDVFNSMPAPLSLMVMQHAAIGMTRESATVGRVMQLARYDPTSKTMNLSFARQCAKRDRVQDDGRPTLMDEISKLQETGSHHHGAHR